MSEQLSKINQLESIISILNVPLINSPPVTLKSLVDHIPTLVDPNINKNLAKTELLLSPLFKNLLISSDSKTTALLLYIKPDSDYHLLQQKRSALQQTILSEPTNEVAKKQLTNINTLYSAHLKSMQNQQAQLITDVRNVMSSHSDNAQLHLGGLPMITSDSIAFIRHDLINFGFIVVLFILVTLAIAFARVRWVVLPLLCCIVSGVNMVGFLGLVDWPVTVVSSNFISSDVNFDLIFNHTSYSEVSRTPLEIPTSAANYFSIKNHEEKICTMFIYNSYNHSSFRFSHRQ